ncbi:PKD domain-containing protein [Methanosphaerula subterraneus]|uniref:PKD domain-containing protein n=1 Tax=Methanosphaerula subterraneus TaxID=3350244 RepID=UPI003F84851F
MRSSFFLYIFCSLLLLLSSVQIVSADVGYGYTGQWNGVASEGGELIFPSGVAVDSAGNVYVTDVGHNQIQRFNSTGGFIISWDGAASAGGQILNPFGVAVDSAGNVYVADTWNNRIQRFTSTGGFITSWKGSSLSGGYLFNSLGVAVDSAGNVYVADTYNNQIQKFTSTGGSITSWKGSALEGGQLSRPYGVAVDSAGNVYVADTDNNQIQKFDATGGFITSWNGAASAGGKFNSPNGVTVDGAGNVYVADTGNNQIQKFNSTGGFLQTWGNDGLEDRSRDGQFNYPAGVAVDSAGNVYVADAGNNRIQKFSPVTTPVADFTANVTTGPAPLTVGFTDMSTEGPTTWAWTFGDGTTSAVQNPVKRFDTPGVYDVSLNATNYSMGTTLSRTGYITVLSNPSLTTITPDSGIADGRTILFTLTGTRFLDQPARLTVSLTKTGQSPITAVVSSLNQTTINGSFILPAGTATGAWTVQVTNGDGQRARIPDAFQISIPESITGITAGFYAIGHIGQAPYSVRFLDQSTGSPTAWHWDFGDGTTSTEQSPTHLFNRTGAYTVALTASNDLESDTVIQYRCIIVNTVPAANFTANATAGRTPFTVEFTDQSTGATGYQWQFGDGATSTEQNPVHTYTTPGSYTVTLVVSAADYGSVFVQKPGYITVTDPPTVGFSANVTAGLSPLAVQFNESTTGSVQYFYWQFGDHTTSMEPNPVHVYDTAGKYTVSLHAIGSNGTQVKTVEQYINVTSPVTPVPTTPAPVNTTTVPTTLVPTNTTVIPTVTTVVPTTTTRSSYNGPHTLPGLLQAEDYDLGGEGIAYHDTTPGNAGGAYRHDDVDIEVIDTDGSPNVGWIRAGEWLAYTVNVGTAGTYDAGFRVASTHTGSTIQVYVDDGTTPVATVTVPNTGDWPVFQTVQVPVTLPAGTHRLKLMFPADYVNINWITFAPRGGV